MIDLINCCISHRWLSSSMWISSMVSCTIQPSPRLHAAHGLARGDHPHGRWRWLRRLFGPGGPAEETSWALMSRDMLRRSSDGRNRLQQFHFVETDWTVVEPPDLQSNHALQDPSAPTHVRTWLARIAARALCL